MSKRFEQGVRAHVARMSERAASGTQFATVTAVDPFTLELIPSGQEVFDDEITMTQWCRLYHGKNTIDVGDTVTVMVKQVSGDIDYVITDIVSDKDLSELAG